MTRLAGLLIKTSILLLICIALLVSCFRYALPHLNTYRETIVYYVQRISGLPVKIEHIQGEWLSIGPSLKLQGVSLAKEGIALDISQINIELDVWRSLLYFRWQFRDLTFLELSLELNDAFFNDEKGQKSENTATFDDKTKRVSNILLQQINYFDLKNSHISFPSLSGSIVELDIDHLTWLNSGSQHKASGTLNLSNAEQKYGELKLIVNLRSDQTKTVSDGTVYLQADDIDMRPWISRWLRSSTGLVNADFSLAAWLNVKDGDFYNGDLLLKQGTVAWNKQGESHTLNVEQQKIYLEYYQQDLLVNLPILNIQTDKNEWPKGSLSLLWYTEENGTPDDEQQLRIRLTDIKLDRIKPLLPIFSFIDPEKLAPWLELDPTGTFSALAMDIPLAAPEESHFIARWQDVSWPLWRELPSIDHFSGEAVGNMHSGHLSMQLNESLVTYADMFRAPLEVEKAKGTLYWVNDDQGLKLWSKALDIQAKNLWVNGDFSYEKLPDDTTWLAILAGIHLQDTKDAWRYYPETLMGTNLVNYLTSALIQGEGKANNATLLFAGSPSKFPFKDNSGLFEVFTPLRDVTFKFQPDWQEFTELNIDLDFINDGLWMKAESGMLGKVFASNITANIPEFGKQKLYVEAMVNGKGDDVHQFFNDSILKDSIGAALNQIQITGDIEGRLHLDIPLSDGKKVDATGHINFNNNNIFVANIGTHLSQVSGIFQFDNSNLTSEQLTAQWLEQPITLSFTTSEKMQDYAIDIDLSGKWDVGKIPDIPMKVATELAKKVDWQGKVNIHLPVNDVANYEVELKGELFELGQNALSLLQAKSKVVPYLFHANGTQKALSVSGNINGNQQINTYWNLTGERLQLTKGVWMGNSDKLPALPADDVVILSLSKVDGDYWKNILLSAPVIASSNEYEFNHVIIDYPRKATIKVDDLFLLGQHWRDTLISFDAGKAIYIDSRELKGSLLMPKYQPWQLDLNYLYYNPYFPDENNSASAKEDVTTAALNRISFTSLQNIKLSCESCWFNGQSYGKISAELLPQGNTLLLRDGLLKAGATQLTIEGEWRKNTTGSFSAFKGLLESDSFDKSMRYFGILVPIYGAKMRTEYELNWLDIPWRPKNNYLSGVLKSEIGKGEVEDVGVGRAGQLLRLVSVSSIVRKLRLDFSDTFSENFYFDSIAIDASINHGVINIDSFLVNGLVADIAMHGIIDVINNKIDMSATVAPELSTTVGVATAFAINPIVGVAVFAASHALTPLWSKVSFIRYDIKGNIDNPNVSEVLRKANQGE